ncbi:hypothetical protein BV25DRAFT_668991 [Artomyces pyxidatus]|uniref:Uncharacterized protein n=1 Tax=Artomyces pyxidatus TaxID=48021 RepID=A0ACB8T0V8_9AGAM|nr:hypothetical protein BV25DRAFT_668991 [Artomyces pyxidatus]
MSPKPLLTIATPLKPTDLPSDDAVLAASRELLASTESWKRGKAYQKNKVNTMSRPKGPGDGASWFARVSEHTAEDATFDEFWSKLGHNHSVNETEYIADVKKATLIKQISPTQAIWSMYYEFGSFGVSSRVFTVLQTTYLDESSPRTGIFTCIPVDVTGDPEMAKLEEGAVKGHYCSVEQIKELPDGNVEWRMATTSSPGGRIPTFLVDSTMASTISADVPHFLNWFHTVRHKASEVVPVKDEIRPPATSLPSESNPNGDVVSAAIVSTIPAVAAAPTGAGAPVL